MLAVVPSVSTGLHAGSGAVSYHGTVCWQGCHVSPVAVAVSKVLYADGCQENELTVVAGSSATALTATDGSIKSRPAY